MLLLSLLLKIINKNLFLTLIYIVSLHFEILAIINIISVKCDCINKRSVWIEDGTKKDNS